MPHAPPGTARHRPVSDSRRVSDTNPAPICRTHYPRTARFLTPVGCQTPIPPSDPPHVLPTHRPVSDSRRVSDTHPAPIRLRTAHAPPVSDSRRVSDTHPAPIRRTHYPRTAW